MEQEKVDRRIKKTKKQLRLALMELMSEKGHRSISVRELAERADMNRGTFYIHYKDVEDLLTQLEDEMAEKLKVVCRRHSSDTEISSYPFLTDLYRFVLENGDMCRVLLGPNGDIAYTERICAILRDDFLLSFLSRLCPRPEEELEYICAFIVSGNLNLALSWLKAGAKESPESMAQLAGELIIAGVDGKRKE